MTRGFVTVATGKEYYFRIAVNLLRSYRLFAREPLPFALICDKENCYSREFDQVIILDSPYGSYLDKLSLPECCPYDETIFIDADCLAYKDLNDFWNVFDNATDFSAFGRDYPTDFEYAWFKPKDVGEFAGQIRSIPDFIGGVYFVRKTPQIKDFAATCRYVLDNYHSYKFRQFPEPADETVFALAMAVHQYTTMGDLSLPVCYYPISTRFKADLLAGKMSYDNKFNPNAGIMHDAYMVHWGSANIGKPVYRIEEYKLNRLLNGERPGKAAVFTAKCLLWLRYHGGRAYRKAKRLMHLNS